MRILPWTTLAAAIVGDDLHTALVSGSILGARAKPKAVLRGFLNLPAEEARRALGGVPGEARIVLVVPGSMTGVRPTALPASKWGAARDEILRSIESLFPIRSADAAVGFIGRRLPDGGEAGYLIAADRGSLKPWKDALARAAGRPVDAVISTHMALMGLGLQAEQEAEVVDQGSPPLAHRLAFGEISELNASVDDGRGPRLHLPGGTSEASSHQTDRHLSGTELAVAAAIAPIVAGGRIVPLEGRTFAPEHRWVPAALSFAALLVIIWMARWTGTARYERGIARLDEERIASSSRLDDARATRDRAIHLGERLKAVEAAQRSGGAGMLAAVDAAHAVLPAGAFLYRVDVDPRTITIKGESARAGDALRALEDAAEFQGARELDTPMTVEERGLEMFNIRADRVDEPAAGEGGGR